MQRHRTSTRNTRALLAAAAVTVAHLAAFTADSHAVNRTWDGGGADNNLNTIANWDGDLTLPAANDAAFFAGATRTTPTASVDVQYLSLFFAAGASAFNIQGPGAITLGSTTAGNYLNNDTVGVTQTISAPVKMIGGNVNATQGGLVFNGLFNVGNGANTTSTNNVTFQGANNITLNGGITGAGTAASAGGAINKGGTGTLLVTADSAAWQGNVFVNGGNLRITNANALGSGGGRIETALSSGGTGQGTLELDGSAGGFTLNKAVTTRARQDATINNVSLRNVAGSNTITTVGTGTGGSRFNYEAAGGHFTIDTWNTTGSGGVRSLRLLGASTGQINNWTPAVGNVVQLIKDDAGTWTLGSGMNHADGVFSSVTVNGGNLILAGGLGARVVGNAANVPHVTVNNGGTLTVQSPDGTTGEVANGVGAPGIITIAAGGTLDASTFSTYNLQANQNLISGGTFKAGTLGTAGDNQLHIGNSTASTAVGTLTVQGNLSLSNAFAANNGGLYFNLGNTLTVGSGANDLISVTGDVFMDNSGGPVNVRLTPLASGLTTGTYRLIEFGTGTTLNQADFNLIGFTPGQTRQSASIVTAPGQVNLSVVGNPANIRWVGNLSDVWESAGPSNFVNTATNQADKFFPFDNAIFDDTSSVKTVNLTGSLVLGSATVNTTSTYTFTGSGSLDGGGTLAKSGNGALILANVGPNTYTGGTTINAGTLQVGNGGADGSLGTGPIVNNGSLVINKSADLTLSNISGSGSLVKQGAANLILNTANTYTGPTTIETGVVQVSNATALGTADAGTTVNSGASLFFLAPASTYNEPITASGDGGGQGALHSGGAVATTLAGPVNLTAPTTINNDGGSSISVTGVLTGAGDLTKAGSGSLIVANPASTWSGNTTVTLGTLQLGAGTAAVDPSTGAYALTGTLSFNSNQNVSFSRTISGAGTILNESAGGTTTLTGDLTAFTGTLSTGNFGVASTLTVAVPTGATVARVWDSNNGGGSTQNGVGFGILRLTNSAALAPTATIDIQAAQAAGTGRLELGNSVNIAVPNVSIAQRSNNSASIQSTDGNNTLTGTITVTTGGNNANLQVDAASTFTVAGTIQPLATAASPRNLFLQGDGAGTVTAVIQNNTQSINLTKQGAGTWTLAAANTYTGNTTVNAGRLVLKPAAYNPVTAGPGFATINGGRLIFDYAGGSSPAPTVLPLLETSADSNFTAGQFRTTQDATHTLGYYDNGTDSLTVMYTYFGDLNLDGRVNADDYALLDRGRAMSLTGWSNGDVNYDGLVNATDYLLTDTAFGSQTAVLSPALLAQRQSQFGDAYVAQLIAAVPEPTSLLAACGLALPLTRRRRPTR